MQEKLTPYQKRLFVFLSVATFFEGYDFLALTQILPQLRAEMQLSPAAGGALIAFINMGTILAFFLVRLADQIGRRKVLTLTIAGYTLCSLLSGLAPGLYSFAIFQLLGRIFLIGEWAVAMVYAAEEFPAARRGMVIGVIQACSSLGSIACAGVVPIILETSWGWRGVFLVGVLPLIIIAFARSSLQETSRFMAKSTESDQNPGAKSDFLFKIWHTPYRNRMLQLALIWSTVYVCTQNAVFFWKEFAMAERSFTDAEVGQALSIAALLSMPPLFWIGRFMDWAGRRKAAIVIFATASAGTWCAYTLQSHWALTAALVLGIIGTSSILPVLEAFTTELFPTELRGDAFAWSNNLLGRIGYVVSPLAVGMIANDIGWGPAVSMTAIFPILALGLLWWLIPETSGLELEEASALPEARA